MHRPAHGFTLIECMVIAASAVILLCAGVVAMSPVATESKITEDHAQLRSLDQAFITGISRGQRPTPSELKRGRSRGGGSAARRRSARSGAGSNAPYDMMMKWDTSSNLYSMMIMLNYFRPRDAVSPLETNPSISAYDAYDYNVFAPKQGKLWDDTYSTALDGSNRLGGHASYYHLALIGERKNMWGENATEAMALLGSRAPAGGAASGPEHDRSWTLAFMGDPLAWEGHIVYGDHAIERTATFAPTRAIYERGKRGLNTYDNLFDCEFGEGVEAIEHRDAWLGMTEMIEPGKIKLWRESLRTLAETSTVTEADNARDADEVTTQATDAATANAGTDGERP